MAIGGRDGIVSTEAAIGGRDTLVSVEVVIGGRDTVTGGRDAAQV